ncbi:fluoride efflux transporter FluC [Wenzhouxiangella sp. EGI_FJ10305]|uniref:fluoride efflux transporter FluC n=1 Tax=Wenzhouxiangella sp. EGI_FJ10305 TaxID=3243768 RepID=UPI0035D7E7B1
MVEIALVALGSGLGAVSRFAMGQWVLRIDSRFPLLATLGVNLSGCGLAGLFAGSAWQSHELAASFLATGFLGSYTTVSSFSLETLGLWQSGRRGRAVAYVLTSMVGGLLLAWAGWLLAAHMAGLS